MQVTSHLVRGLSPAPVAAPSCFYHTSTPRHAAPRHAAVGQSLSRAARGKTSAARSADSNGSGSVTTVQPVKDHASKQAADQKQLAEWGRDEQYAEVAYLTARTKLVAKHFPTALGVDDLINRLEIALFAYGFTGDNSIAMSNLCRDEITATLKHKLDQVFGSSFNTNGLGGVLTCGVTGVKAGLSHSPVSAGSGKERYVFFSFPHISIDASGAVGTISRPGRPGDSCACGALAGALTQIHADGLEKNCKIPGEHDPLDPEFTILKQRLARRMRYEGLSEAQVKQLDLVEITKVAERTITDDLEYLIRHTVDPKRADYAVVTGVQIHSFSPEFDDDSIPNLEFVAPSSVYAVVAGTKTNIDLNSIPSFTPRQIRMLAAQAGPGAGRAEDMDGDEILGGNSTTLRAIDSPTSINKDTRRMRRQRAANFAALLDKHHLEIETTCKWPAWQSRIKAYKPHRAETDNSTTLDENYRTMDPEDGGASSKQAAFDQWYALGEGYEQDDEEAKASTERKTGGVNPTFQQDATDVSVRSMDIPW